MKKNQSVYTNQFTGNELDTYTPTAFRKIRDDFGLKQLSKKTNNKEKLTQQQDNFSKRYICPFCNSPQSWVENTNVMVCSNPNCKGKPIKCKDGKIKYLPVYAQLNHRGAAIAETILSKQGE